MTISPSELRTYASEQIDIDRVIGSTDILLKKYAEKNNVEKSFTISIQRLPEWALAEVCRRYKEAGWHSVTIARNADAFVYLEFVP